YHGKLTSPDHAADLPDHEPVNPKPALVIHHHAPAPPEGYSDDDDMKDDEEDSDEDPEEEPIKQDDDKEVEEDGVDDVDDEEMKVDEEDKDDGVDDNKDKAKVINAYEDVDPLNRPPSTSNEETEFAPPVVVIADVNNEPIPPVIPFGHNFYAGEGSSAGALLAGNSEVNAPGLIACNLESVRRVAARLDKQMFDRYRTEKKMAKKFKEEEFCMNSHEYDIIALDAAVRKNSSEHFEMKKTMPLRRRSQTNPQPLLTQEAINQLVQDRIEAVIRAERERVREEATRTGGPVGGPATAPVATLGLKVTNGKPWAEVKKMMIDEFYPIKEFQRFNELALLCPDAVPNEKKKAKLYIKGLPEVIKGEITSSRPDMLNDAMRMVHTLIEQKIQAKNERVAEGNKKRWENNNQGGNYNRNNHGNYHDNNRHSQYNQRRDAEQGQGPNVVTGTLLINNLYARLLFDSYSDKSFVNYGFSHLIDIKPVIIKSVFEKTIYQSQPSKLGMVILSPVDFMPIELGTFNVIIGMDWLVKHDALIVCEKKEIHIPIKEEPIEIIDREVKQLKQSRIPIVKICWNSRVRPEVHMGTRGFLQEQISSPFLEQEEEEYEESSTETALS
nr:hypothetical protein [Tanacetum cinerariifolium]